MLWTRIRFATGAFNQGERSSASVALMENSIRLRYQIIKNVLYRFRKNPSILRVLPP